MTDEALIGGLPIPVEIRAPRSAWFTLWAILALGMFGFVDRQVLTLVSAPLATALHLSDSQLGAVQGLAFAIFTVAAVYPLGWAADRFDRRVVLGACVVLWSAGTAACGLVHNFTQLFIAAIAIAAGEAGVAPIALAIIPDLFHGRQRVFVNALNYTSATVGVSVALMLGGVAISALDTVHPSLPATLQAFEPWRLAFLLVAAPAPVFLVLIAFMQLRRTDSAGTRIDPVGQDRLLPYVRANWSTLTLIFGGIAFGGLAFGGFLAWLPVATSRLFGASVSENGLGMGLASGCGALGGVTFATLLLRHYGSRLGSVAAIRICWIAMAAVAPVLLVFPFVTTTFQVYLAMGLMMWGGTVMGALSSNILQALAPASVRARIFSIYIIVSGLIGGSSPTLVGLVSDYVGGPRGLFDALTIVSFPAWLVATSLFWASERPFVRTAAIVAATTERSGK